jgi:anti-sigma regulatory factor (Ser/Thr protein kinase)
MRRELQLSLSFPPEWDRIEPIRKAVALCVAAVFDDLVFRDALAMTCAELLENAVKYGAANGPTVRVAVREQPDAVILEVTNSADEGSPHPAALAARIAWLRGFADPAEAYTAALGEIYDKVDATNADSGLGIVRVAYEGGCFVDCDVSNAQQITVVARFARPTTSLGPAEASPA